MPTTPERKPRYQPPARPRVVKVHFNDEELAAVKERATRYGRGNMSGYLRAAALGQPVPVAAAVPTINAEQYAELGRAAANLNQIARHLNLGNVLTDQDLMPVLRQLYTDLQQVRRMLLGTEDVA